MICEHPECTGKHDNSRPWAERCPATKEQSRKRCREHHREKYANDPDFRERRREESRDYKLTAAGMRTQVRENAKKRGNR